MQTIFFFYGLAFLVMGISIFLMPKKNDLLDLSEDLWLVGLFGVLHGANEWVDMLILRGTPFVPEVLAVLGAFLLPLSFASLLQFGVWTLFRETRLYRSLKYLWIIALVGWAVACFLTSGFLIPGIVARYFIGFPGAILTAAGLLQAVFRADKKRLPATVFGGAVGAAAALVLYGIFSGLMVPEADFLLASFINDTRFFQITGMQVQFFRMLCAIFLAVCFFATTGIYFHEPGTDRILGRGGIRRRLILWLSIVIFSIVVVQSVLGFWYVLRIRERTAGESLYMDAKLLAVSISRTLNQEMERLRVYFSDSGWEGRLTEANAKYELLSSRERKDRFRSMDLKWADPSAAGLEKYLEGSLISRLKAYTNTEKRFAEIFLTDREGGLVAASGKTTDFFQADETWWQDAFNGGKGSETVRDLSWDDSSGTWSVDLALPVKDGKGNVLGIVKQVINSQAFFDPLKDYRIGGTGHAVLVNAAGDILFHQKITPLSKKYCDEKKIRELLLGSKHWAVLSEAHGHKEEMFVAFAKVESPALESSGIRWYVFVDQSKEEIFSPLGHVAFIIGAVACVFLLIFIGAGCILSEKMVKPLRELSRATQEIRKGNWDYSVTIRSGDEIQELAESFRYMVEDLRQRQAELLRAKEEIDGFSKSLEKKVEERTKDLSESQRATMNILEDLTEANEKLKKFTEELTRAKENLETQSWGLQKANDGIKALYAELERKNADLAKLDRLKDDFVSIVAHELRNPLGVVREAASLILDGLAGPVEGEQKKYIEIIQKTGDRLIRITTDLLDLAKIEAGKIVVNYEKMDLLSLARQACEGIALRAHKKGLTITQVFPGEKLEISGDFDKLSQVMSNLLSNAFKFTEKGGITVEIRDLGEEVRCIVKDTGPGISKENIARLFSKFEQFGQPTTSSEKGSGLGLVISQSIVEAHGGRIWAESAPGQGTSLIFTLPKEPRQKKLGEILVEEKRLTPEQLAAALRKQNGQKS